MEKVWYRINELTDLGYTRRQLMNLYHRPGQRYARKMNPTKHNSPIEFNLPLLQEAERKDIEMQARARERMGGVYV